VGAQVTITRTGAHRCYLGNTTDGPVWGTGGCNVASCYHSCNILLCLLQEGSVKLLNNSEFSCWLLGQTLVSEVILSLGTITIKHCTNHIAPCHNRQLTVQK